MNSWKETITLCWSIDDESWSHWAQGRGQQTARAVVLEGLHEIRRNPQEAAKIRLCCKRISREKQESIGQDTQRAQPHKIEIQLPAADWGEACQRVGNPDGNPVRPSQLLKAVILESKSWKQSGNADAEFNAGWSHDSLISSIALSAELTHTKINLGKQEKVIALIGQRQPLLTQWPLFWHYVTDRAHRSL